MWKWASTKGGDTRYPSASITRPASPAMARSTAAMRPPRTAMSRPVRPSGSVAFRTRRSKVIVTVLAREDSRGVESAPVSGWPRRLDGDGVRSVHDRTLTLSLEIGDHQGFRIIGAARDHAECADREKIGEHQ